MQQAPRDTPAAAPPPAERGTSPIKGRVVTAETAVPIRGALVTVSAPGVRPRNLYTDAEGRYEARNLPAGSYRVSARPSVRQARFLSPPPAPTPVPAVTLAAGQTIEWYDLTLVRAGAIVGRVVDENGDPVGGVSITAQRAGESQAMSGFPAQISDELGRYRVFRLPAGDYEIALGEDDRRQIDLRATIR